jgi:hypothetical protein
MMETHVCATHWGDVEALAWRLMLSLFENDDDAYTMVMTEIATCPTCLANVLHHALRGWAAYVMLGAGGKAKAADLAAETVQRYLR